VKLSTPARILKAHGWRSAGFLGGARRTHRRTCTPAIAHLAMNHGSQTTQNTVTEPEDAILRAPSRRATVRLVLCAGILAVLIAWAALWPYTGYNDSALHFVNLRASVHDARKALHPWARPIFVLLFILPAMGGILAVRCFAAVLATILAWQTMRLADDLRLPNATLAGLLLVWQPLYFALAADTMSEMPMALGIVLAIRLWASGRRGASCALVSFLPMVRPEGFVLVPIWGVMVLAGKAAGPFRRRRVPTACLLGAGVLGWMAACWAITGDPIDFIRRWSWPARSYASYGRGHLLHHVFLWPFYCGPIVLVLFLVGIVPSLRRRMALPWAVWAAVFGVHSVLWWRGWFAALGLMRIQACTAPVTALVCLYGWNTIASCLARRGVGRRARRFAAALAMILATASVFAYYAFDVRRYRCFPIRRAVAYLREHRLLAAAPAVFASDHVAWAEMGLLPTSPRALENSYQPAEQLRRLADLPPGSAGVWDNQVGVFWYRVQIDEIPPRRECPHRPARLNGKPQTGGARPDSNSPVENG